MKENISRIREVTEESLKKLEDSLSEGIKSSLDISKEISGVRRELELRRKGQPGFCQKHGHTYLLWESGKGWHCADCIKR